MMMRVLVGALCWFVADALYEDQVGEQDWTLEQMGSVTHAVFQQNRIYALTVARRESGLDENLVVALNSRTGEIEWRRFLPEARSDALVLTPNGVVTLSGGLARCWRLGDGALAWDSSVARGGDDEATLLSLSSPSKCVVVAIAGNAASAVSCDTGSPVQGWPWYPEAEDDASLASALAQAGVSASTKLKLTSAIAVGPSEVLVAGVGLEIPGVSWVAKLGVQDGEPTSSSAFVFKSRGTQSPTSSAQLLARGKSPVLVTITGDSVHAWDATGKKRGEKPLVTRDSETFVDGGEGTLRAKIEPNSASVVLRISRGKSERLVVASADDAEILEALGDGPCGDDCLALGSFASPVSAASGSPPAPGESEARVFWSNVSSTSLSVAEIGSSSISSVIPFPSEALPDADHGVASALFPHVFEKKNQSGLVYRSLLVTAADTVAMVDSEGVSWLRDEALASVEDVGFVSAPLKHHHVNASSPDGATVIVPSWSERLSLQVESVVEKLESSLSLFDANGDNGSRKRRIKLANAERYGFDKLVVARTASGRLFAIAAHTGDVVWSLLLPGGRSLRHRVVATRRDEDVPELTVFSVGGEEEGTTVTRIDAHTGVVVREESIPFVAHALVRTGAVEASTGRDATMVVGPGGSQVTLSPATESATQAFGALSKPFYFYLVIDEEDGSKILRSFRADKNASAAVAVGDVVLTTQKESTLLDVVSSHPEEVVSSKAHVLGDDAILLKYLNPHVAAVCVSSPGGREAPLLDAKLRTPEKEPVVEPPSLYVTLVDVVASKIVARVVHPHGAGPCRVSASENWIVYSYYNTKSKRSEVGSLTLHEGMFDRYGLSPFKIPEQESTFESRHAPPPVALHRTFAIEKPVVANIAPTLTSRGIASKHFLVGISPGQILALDRRALDPRRPLMDETNDKTFRQQRKKFERELDEGLAPYSPFVPVRPRNIITYSKEILGLRKIWATPTKLESTTLVFSAGIDLHSARHTPSGAFDLLADDFKAELLLVLLFGLAAGAFVLRLAANRKNLKLNWA